MCITMITRHSQIPLIDVIEIIVKEINNFTDFQKYNSNSFLNQKNINQVNYSPFNCVVYL